MSQALETHVHGDDCWPDLKDETGRPTFIIGKLTGIARLPGATAQGKSSVTVRVELPNGQTVLAQTTLALMRTAMLAINAAEAGGPAEAIWLAGGELAELEEEVDL